MSVYMDPGKQPSDTISCQNDFIASITFYSFLCLFAEQSINLIRIEAILLSKQGLGAFRIVLRCFHVKQNGTDCTAFIFVPPADAEQSCTELLEQSCIGFTQSRKNKTPIRYEKGSDT